MIVVDTSVWIDHFRARADLPHVQTLRALVQRSERIVVGDLILLELLSGAPDETRARRMEAGLRTFDIEAMLDDRLAVQAADYYRTLRAAGITIRRSADMIIATFCLARGYALLHNDRDFLPIEEKFGLRTIRRP